MKDRLGESVLTEVIMQMKEKGVSFGAGLTDAEVAAAEARFAFRFPPDLRAFLQLALPGGEGFPDWRSNDSATLQAWLDMPREGVLFDIEHNGFWLDEWGVRPPSLDGAKQIARGLIAAAPKLIPIYIHRMMPDEPHESGNPVFSVHQTDIIHFGVDLTDYLRQEFSLPGYHEGSELILPEVVRPIRFWDIERLQQVRWANEPCATDPRTLPEDWR